MTQVFKHEWLSATDELYAELEHAYQVFNAHLFGGELPGCLITLQRTGRYYGYFSATRFLRRDARGTTDEIALNPRFFAFRTVAQSLSTLVHEMVHQWQRHFGKPSRGGYHNREWAEKMKEIGLMPSTTGLPGGAETGPRMTHYILFEGRFQRVCEQLMAESPMLTWVDVDATNVSRVIDLLAATAGTAAAATNADLSAPPIAVVDPLSPATQPGEPDPKRKLKYTCPGCGINVWGKPALAIACVSCDTELELNPGKAGRVTTHSTSAKEAAACA